MTHTRNHPTPNEIAYYMKRASQERSAVVADLLGRLWRRLAGGPQPVATRVARSARC